MEERAPVAVAADPTPDHSARLGAGIIGTGFIGRVHARSALLAGAKVAAVAASSDESAASAAADLGAANAFTDGAELIAADGVDVVHICAPNNLHHELALTALAAGKHVVVEKPVALDRAEAESLAAAAQDAGVVVTVPFAYRYYPTVREARARVRSGSLGELRLLQGGYLQDWLLSPEDDNWRVEASLGGRSRAFADIGSHLCDLLEFASGHRIVALCAQTTIAHAERRRSTAHSFARGGSDAGEPRPVETEDIATLLFETDGGAAGSAVVSQVSAGRKNRLWFEFSGLDGAVAFEQERPETLWIGTGAGAEVLARDPNTLSAEAGAYATLPGGHPQGFHDLFDAFVAETYALIGGAAAADGLPMLADGVRAVALTEAVLESAAARGWVEVDA